jgi:hypothetical protein
MFLMSGIQKRPALMGFDAELRASHFFKNARFHGGRFDPDQSSTRALFWPSRDRSRSSPNIFSAVTILSRILGANCDLVLSARLISSRFADRFW